MPPIDLSKIRRDPVTQTRAKLDAATVAEYADALGDGEHFPPVTLYKEGEVYYIADGWHRIAAMERLGGRVIEAEVRHGSQRDAVFAALGSNRAHGLRRTNADKRRCVVLMVSDPEWSEMSDRKIAETVGVSHTFVSNVRHEVGDEACPFPEDEETEPKAKANAESTPEQEAQLESEEDVQRREACLYEVRTFVRNCSEAYRDAMPKVLETVAKQIRAGEMW